MKKLVLLFSMFSMYNQFIAQCTTTNATSCVCADCTQNCLLLPDITASWKGISNGGWTEYPQTGAGTNYNGQGPDNGRLRVTGSHKEPKRTVTPLKIFWKIVSHDVTIS